MAGKPSISCSANRGQDDYRKGILPHGYESKGKEEKEKKEKRKKGILNRRKKRSGGGGSGGGVVVRRRTFSFRGMSRYSNLIRQKETMDNWLLWRQINLA